MIFQIHCFLKISFEQSRLNLGGTKFVSADTFCRLISKLKYHNSQCHINNETSLKKKETMLELGLTLRVVYTNLGIKKESFLIL
ncbi:hypothetical protein BpHYR1_041679 [Brachionus plicatilis]|uniref:Uncharacterized protein n=1 Tax=Brachionus plicatilis TaxID=10195 RepID=A0A3M7ST20_BRAPC|nr:hypothetical protein BpHYR1_041679 [Brachionus plicatilis]